MRDVLTVFRFTLRDALRKKAFILTTVIVLVLIVAGCTVLRVVDMNKSAPDAGTAEPAPAEKSDTCYLIDDASLIPGALEALTAAQPTVDFVAGQSNKLNDYKAEVETDKSKSILVIAAGKTGQPELTFYSTDFMSGLPAETLTRVVQNVYVAGLLSQAGVSADVQQAALTDLSYSSQIVGKMDVSGYAIGILLTIIVFFAVYYYGYGVAMSVASEKTSRVMETLVVSAKPSRILLGKCLAMGVLGLVQLLAFLVVGAVCFATIVPAGFTIMGHAAGTVLLHLRLRPAGAGLLPAGLRAVRRDELGLRRDGQPRGRSQLRYDAGGSGQPHLLLCGLRHHVPAQRGH